MKRDTSGDSFGLKRAASGDSGSSATSRSLASGSKRPRKVDTRDDCDSASQSSKRSKGKRVHPEKLSSSQASEFDRLASHFIASDIGTVSAKPIPLRFMARTRHVAWQWRTKSGIMQYQALIGGGTNTPEDSL